MAKQFYRQDKDIFDASNNQRIGSDDWSKNWSGQANELKAIDGAKYNTKELQQGSYSDIRAIGKTLYGSEIVKPTTPATFSDVQSQLPSVESFKMEQERVNNASIMAGTNSAKALKERIEAQKMLETSRKQAEAQAEVDRQRDERNTEVNKAKDDMAPIRDRSIKQADNLGKAFFINEEEALEKANKIDKLTSDLESYYQDYQKDIESVGHAGQLQSMNAKEINNVKKNYESKIGIAEALIKLTQGNINYAIDVVTKSANSIQAINTTEKNLYQTILSWGSAELGDAETELTTLTTEQKEQYKSYIADLDAESKLIESNTKMIQDYMKDPKTAKFAHEAGLALTDTPDQMAEKLGNYFANKPEEIKDLTFEQRLKMYENGLVMDNNGNFSENTSQNANLSIGNGTITALNGSKFWEWGLDFVVEGGKGADVETPFSGEVIQAGENGGFGNQVKIRLTDFDEYGNPIMSNNSEEIWLSHLDSMNVKVGDFVNEYSSIGKQGNSGNVYSTSGGDGTHLDITMKKADGSFYKAHEVAGLLGYQGGEKKELTSLEKLQAHQLMTTITKGKGTTEYKETVLESIKEMMQEGKSLDNIEDELRYSSVSKEFEGNFKGAFEYITKAGFSTADRESAKDGLDELLASGDTEGAKDYTLGLARDKATGDEYKRVTGREEALISIMEIEKSLNSYIESGGDTGLLTGAVEGFNQTVLKKTGDSNLANIANEIKVAIQTYRQAISGAAFTESESKEYDNIFPNIGKSKELNQAKIDSLKTVYSRNQTLFYRRTMGTDNYNALFNESGNAQSGVTSSGLKYTIEN